MYVENMKLALIALGITLTLIFVIGIPLFLMFYYWMRHVVRMLGGKS